MTDVLAHTGHRTAPAANGGEKSAHAGFRPDVQGLRALAVSLVVLYHLYPRLIPGGYIGVDVFFVISGFLITGLLARGIQKTGRVDLFGFYARRARRLLPASILVLTVTWLLARQVLPVTQLPAAAQQIRASALYFQNWVLASNSVDYLKSDSAASPVQHFWSLSVEEQFYLVWPVIFIAAAAATWMLLRHSIARGEAGQSQARIAQIGRRLSLVLAVAIVLLSLRYSAHETTANPAAAYFQTPTRIWELGIGGVLALLPLRVARRIGRIGMLAWIGLIVVIASAFMINGSTAFPGTIALFPVLGTAAILAAGSAEGRLGTAPVMSRRELVLIGDLSYGIYLWHWPLIVLWQAYHGPGIGYLDGPAIIVASIVLAYLTKRLVEDPIRTGQLFTKSAKRSLAVVALTAIPVALVSVFLLNLPGAVTYKPDANHPGAAALSKTSVAATSTEKASAIKLIPSLTQVATDFSIGTNSGCKVHLTSTTPTSCTFGDVTNPRLTVALVGDSHAAQWSTDLDVIGKQQHWKIVELAHDSCPFGATLNVFHGAPFTSCQTWGKNVLAKLLGSIHPAVVIVSERPANGVVGDSLADPTSMAAIGRGMATYWQTLMAHGIEVVGIKESPEPGKNIPDCLAANSATIESCSVPASVAVIAHTPIDAASKIVGAEVPVIDMTSHICTSTTCPAVVGNVIVYRDNHHLSQTYTLTLEGYMRAALLKIPALSPTG